MPPYLKNIFTKQQNMKKLFTILLLVLMVNVVRSQNNDIQIIVSSPFEYGQVPIFQAAAIPSTLNITAQIKNSDNATAQTNVKITATLNGVVVGTSTPLASLAPLTTSGDITFSIPFSLVIGDNTLVCTASADQTDGNISNNSATFVIQGTADVYAADVVDSLTAGVGSPNPASLGQIYKIKESASLKQVMIGFGPAVTTLDYSVSLYKIVGENAIAETPLFTVTATREPIFGFVTLEVPFTALDSGDYFLCVNQHSSSSVSIAYDKMPGKYMYFKNEEGKITPYITHTNTVGSLAIRMILQNLIPFDAGILEIADPERLTANADVTVTIMNYGTNNISSLNVTYIFNDEAPVTQTFTGNIPSLGTTSFTFNKKIDLSQNGFNDLIVYTTLPGDNNSLNDTAKMNIRNFAEIELYGYCLFRNSAGAREFVSFNSNTPENIVIEKNYLDITHSMAAGEYYNGNLYVFTQATSNQQPETFVKLSDSWEPISSVPIQKTPLDMAYDHSTNTMYAIATDNIFGLSELYTVDLETGYMNFVILMTQYFSVLACSFDGQLYAVTGEGDLYSIDKTNGNVHKIGFTGYDPNFRQSMAFDHNSGRLLWAYLGGTASSFISNLIEINPATGECINLGNLGGVTGAEIVALHTKYENIGIRKYENDNVAIYPNPATDQVTIEGIPNSTLRIFDITGKMIMTTTIQDNQETINISYLNSGIYFLELQDENTKTVKKLIKR